MSINSEQVLRKMNEIQSKGGVPIAHWHSLRQWLLEPEQLQENFLEAVMNDKEMTPEQKEYWLSSDLQDLAREAEEWDYKHNPTRHVTLQKLFDALGKLAKTK
jgi:hypothetical protein